VPRSVRIQLSAMMFLQYFVPGLLLPIFSLYLMQYLQFTPAQVGWIFAMPAVGAFISPYIISQVADRWVSAERLVMWCHGLAAIVMALLSLQDSFWPFLVLYTCYSLVFVPTIALTNAVAMHHLADTKRDFGGIRVWGTVGWIAAAWSLGFLYLEGGPASMEAGRLPDALKFCAGASLLLSIYAWTLPRSHVHVQTRASFLPWHVFRDFTRPSLIVLLVTTFAFGITNQFFFQGTSPFLEQRGFGEGQIMTSMSLGQVCELFTLGFSGLLLMRFSVKAILAFSLAMQAGRFLLFATSNDALIYLGLSFQGFAFLYYAVAVIYVDIQATREKRAGMQQLYALVMAGLGNGLGSLFAGLAGTFLRLENGEIAYRPFWLLAALLAAGVLVFFMLCFREEPGRERTAQAA